MTAKDLKNALLQEAVQGKLVPQIASEGNARDLLEEIRKEKYHTDLQIPTEFADNKNSKSSDLRSKSQIRVIKKEKPLPEITEDEIPFDIPENWCWCRLGDLCELITKGSSPSWQGINYVDDGILFITSENVGDEELLLSKKKFLESRFNEIQSRSILKQGDILTNIVGASIGRSSIFDLAIDNANINQAVCLVRLINLDFANFIVKVLNSRFLIEQMMNNTVDTARANISLTTVANFLIPLPPIEEQRRIVATLEQFMPLIEEYGKKEAELKELNANISALTKKAILQEAVQGKLVSQLASEGNAKDLLEEIKKEKYHTDLQIPTEFADNKNSKSSDLRSKSQICVIKKERPLPEITEDEIPFDIPENWCWCRQSDIALVSTGMTPLKTESRFYENGNIPWITSSLTDKDYIDTPESFITNFALENTNLNLYPKHTLILAMYGQGKTRGQISELLIPATINQACAAIELYNSEESFRKYIKLFHNWNYNNIRKESFGSAQPNLNLGKVQSTLIPLPPLAEQKRIVAAIEQLLPLCEKLGV